MVRKLLLAALIVLFGRLDAARAADSVRPVELRCEYREDPAGIGELHPRLGWKLEAVDPAARDLRQTGYEILVARSAEALAAGRGDQWDSGQISSADAQNIVYAGPAFASGAPYWWKVRVWDQDGRPGAWSAPARWSMGLLGAGEWRARWIGRDEPKGGGMSLDGISWFQAPLAPSKSAPLTVAIRRGFTVAPGRTVARATLLLVPDQVCRVTVNGRPVGETARWSRAVPLDLTSFLVPGDNVIGLTITQEDGYDPSVVGQLELKFDRGGPVRLPIDASWHYSAAPAPGWDSAAFDDGAWASLAEIPEGKSPWGPPQDATLALPPAPYLRKDFTVPSAVRRATLYATALGLYRVELNGRKVGADYFTPGWTDYRRRVDYQTYDVTALLRRGPNAIGAILGDGWFAGSVAFTGRRHLYGGEPRFAAQLAIEYADGRRKVIATDGSWRTAVGPIRYADLLQGCAYDARLAWRGWSEPGFDDSRWSPVAEGLHPDPSASDVPPAAPLVEAASIDPVRVTERLPARSVASPRPGVYVVDFGQNLVGWVELRVHGRSGQRILVRHGEMLNPNGTVYTSNLRGAAAADVYWLRGNGEETLAPFFTFHGFRYAEITGLDASPRAEDFTGVAVQSHLERTGGFACSLPSLNRLYENILWGQRGNYLEVPTDCPQRDERLGWTGDTQFFIRTATYNYNVAAFIERWIRTLATDEQGDDGTFPDVAPSIGRPARAITGWGDAAIVTTYTLWKVYGDTQVVERHFDELGRYLDWLYADSSRGIVTVGGYGDWLNKGGGAKTEVIDTAYYSYLSGLMADMAAAIGRTDEAAAYARRRDEVAGAFERRFLEPDGGILESSQTGFALAFTMGLVPPDREPAVAAKFVASIADHGWHLATGFIGTPRLLPALHEAGRDDVAYRLLLQDTYPSWLFQVKNGATTMWERWDGWTPQKGFQSIGMNSFNHYAFGSVGEYLYRFVAGIETDGPGFRRIILQPTPGPGLTWARGAFDAPSGRIASAWRVEGGRLTVDFTVPPNVTATVRLPTGEAPFVIGSGTYHYERPAPAEIPAAR